VSRKRLGRGLDALLSAAAAGADESSSADISSLDELPITDIVRGRYQPRREFDQGSLEELAASIRAQGVMQPVVVRPRAQGGYELIAGERRWRAAQLAGLAQIPAVIRDVSDEQASAMALIENIQREDLNPLEEAAALDRLKDEFELTQQQVADAVGKSRVAVTNLLRLLNLAPAVRNLLSAGDLEMGHARALLSLSAMDQERLAADVVERQLSVRQTEALVRNAQSAARSKPAKPAHSADTARLERELSDRLGAEVRIDHKANGKGRLVIGYSTLEELDGILRHLK
jgi:ParB family transcriptional regulator, chromosome partitioning protein